MVQNKSTAPILIVTENLNVGGAEKYTVLVANELHRRGHRVVVFANQGPFRKHFDPGIRFVRAFFEHGIFGVLYGAFQMVRICRQENIRLIHAQKLQSSQAAWIARFITGVPIVKTAHGYTVNELETLGTVIDKYSDKVIAVVDWLADELARTGVDPEKLSVIHNGMTPLGNSLSTNEKLALREQLGINATDPVIVSVARLERGKNYASLIHWFPAVLTEVPNAKLIIVGSGPERTNLIAHAQELGIDNALVFVEGTTYMEPYLRIANVFCTPTVARGMAVLEAMEASLPVVGTRPKGPPEVVVNGKHGFVAASKTDGDAFVKGIVKLLKNPAVARQMGKAAKAHARKLYSHEKMVDEIEAVYAAAVPGLFGGQTATA